MDIKEKAYNYLFLSLPDDNMYLKYMLINKNDTSQEEEKRND